MNGQTAELSYPKRVETFLGYARQVLEQAALLEETYKKKAGRKQEFCVSTQHYSFAVNAFVELIEQYGSEKYDFCLRETQTYEIIGGRRADEKRDRNSLSERF